MSGVVLVLGAQQQKVLIHLRLQLYNLQQGHGIMVLLGTIGLGVEIARVHKPTVGQICSIVVVTAVVYTGGLMMDMVEFVSKQTK